MAKVSPNSIVSLNEDWGNDERTNLPFGGWAVQSFIKSYLKNVSAAAWYNQISNLLYFFASEDDKNAYIANPSLTNLILFSCPIHMSSLIYKIDITNNNGTTNLNVASNEGTLVLSTSFLIQEKPLGDPDWIPTQTGAYVTISIDRGVTGNFVPITPKVLYEAGSTVELDVFPELQVGQNRVRFTYEAEDGSVTQALTYSVNLVELYVDLFSNTWYEPVLQDDMNSWYLGGFKISGSGYKTLHLDIYDEAGEGLLQLEQVIGTTDAYVHVPYYYRFDVTSPILELETGIYKVRVYVSTPELTSEWIEYSIMYVSQDDTLTAKLVVANLIADEVYNYSTSTVCKYGVYNGGSTQADVDVTFTKLDGETVVDTTSYSLYDLATSTEQTLEYLAEWAVTGDGYFIKFEIANDESVATATIPLNNTYTFPPTPGFDFYLSASTRYNNDVNKDKIINESNGNLLNATWSKVDFLNGVDGWTTDEDDHKCLLIPAGCSLTIPASEFAFFDRDNITIELAYKVSNVSDYSENVLTIASNPLLESFSGLRLRPNNITIHSTNDVTSEKDSARGTNLLDEELVHLVITINPNFEGNHKIVKGFVNGCKNFEFAYNAGSDWLINSDFVIAPQKSDVYLYFARRYPMALADQMVQNNYINSLYTLDERKLVSALLQSVVDPGQVNIDYEAVKNNGYNFFVIEMQDGASIPSAANGWGKKTTGKSILEMHYGEHPEWDWRIGPLETAGQGTTSMNYYRWNIRFRIDKTDATKKVPVQYLESRMKVGDSYQYIWKDPSDSKVVYFDGEGNHPALKRITAKINAASSMQSHKMGATKAYNDLEYALGLKNEAQINAESSDKPVPVTAVYQYPAFGFAYDSMYDTYTFCGLFTIGPDKGDKPSFGYDSVEDELISLEGTDHSQLLAKFAYPWNEEVQFLAEEEGLSIIKAAGEYETGFEVGNCYGLSTDKASDQDAIRQILNEEFKPAYDLVWNNSTLIFPIALGTYGNTAEATLSYINSHLQEFRSTVYNDRFYYSDMQFWIEGEYKLYYYDIAQEKYVEGQQLPSPSTGTLEQQNENYKLLRRLAFKEEAENYWDIQDALYHFDFLILFGATDNFAKNSYPYKMKSFANGGRWKWRQDDLDSIFDIDNSGADTKPYYIEYEDAVDNSPYFAGSSSLFWNLIFECYWDDYTSTVSGVNTRGLRTMGRDIIYKMRDLSNSSNPYDGFINYIKQTFWNKAQNYFPQSAYNIDANFKYELAWINNGQSVDPLSQALGNHKSGEMLWVKNRAIYMLSLFRAGAFGDYSDVSLGSISFRPTGIDTTLVPSMWMYPGIGVGQGSFLTGDRTQPGQGSHLATVGDGNTAFYIQGSNYLSSLGDWKGLTLGAQYVNPMTITGAKLTTFKVGDAIAGSVTTNIPGLTFANTKCLEIIDGRNTTSLTNIDVSNCSRLKELYLTGSSVPNVNIPNGSKIEHLSLPDTIQNIVLKNVKHLATENLSIAGYNNIRTILIEHTLADGITITKNTVNNGSSLVAIRLIWDGLHTDTDGTTFNTLLTLTDGTYKGLTSEGELLDDPVIEGTVYVPGTIHTADLIHVEEACPNVTITADRVLVDFADPYVEAIALANWDTDHSGDITLDEALAVTNLSTLFRQNTNITTFDELQFFEGLTSIYGNGVDPGGAFGKCTNLRSIHLPKTVTILNAKSFLQCTSLETVKGMDNVIELGNSAFAGCSALSDDISIPKLETIGDYAFINCASIEKVMNLGNVNTLPEQCFNKCTSLNEVHLPSSIKTIGFQCFKDCANLEFVTGLENVEVINGQAFMNCASFSEDLNLENLTSFGGTWAFYGCQNLKKVISLGRITDTKGSNNDSAGQFQSCTSLEEMHLPSTIETVGPYFVWGCTNLKTITGLENVRTLSPHSIQYCSALEIDINMPNLQSIGACAFYGDSSIKKVISLGSITTLPGGNNTGMFMGCDSLEEVNLPATCTTIGWESFKGCSNLKTVTGLSNINAIEIRAFYNCTSLETISDLSNIQTIEENAFRNCTALQIDVDFGNLTTLQSGAFQSCASIKKVLNLGSITDTGGGIEGGTFQACTSLEEVHLPTTLQKIGYYFCKGDTSLETLTGGQNVTWIREAAFNGCSNLESNIYFPNLQTLEWAAFNGCSKIKNANIGDVTTIPTDVFANCTSLETVQVSNTVTTINARAFKGCTALKTITDLENVEILREQAFQNCSSLEIDIDLPNLQTVEPEVFGRCSSIKKVLDLGEITEISGNGQGMGMFRDCTSLEEVHLPSTIYRIRGYGFAYCSNLQTITGLENVSVFDGYALFRCSSLAIELNLPYLTTISYDSFQACGITKIVNLGYLTNLAGSGANNGAFAHCTNLQEATLPASLTSIGSLVFRDCTALKKITVNAVNPPTLASDAFWGVSKYKIFVPGTSIKNYVLATNWGASHNLYNTFPKETEVNDPYAIIKGVWLQTSSNTTIGATANDYSITFNIPVSGTHNLTIDAGFVYDGTAGHGKLITLDKDFEGVSSYDMTSRPRTVNFNNGNVKYVRMTVKTSELANCYIYDNVTNEYLWRGSDVTTIFE